jgi:carbon-monoxide dehydrogenase large subunit
MPYSTPFKIYDSGDFTAHMKRAWRSRAGRNFPKRAKAAKKQGLVRSIELGSYVEVCGSMGATRPPRSHSPNGDAPPDRHAVERAGARPPMRSSSPAVRHRRARAYPGDTDQIPTGMGSGGSSSIPSGGVCVERATRELGTKLKEIAAQALEAGIGDLEINNGTVRVAGTDRSISFADLARRPGVDPAKLNASSSFNSAMGTYPNGTHLAEVEIDPATGIIRIVNYVIVDDFGVTSIHDAGRPGSWRRDAGHGQALMEQAVYGDKDGQLVTGTFMDYALPRAADGPSFVFETHNVPCTTNPLGVKARAEPARSAPARQW